MWLRGEEFSCSNPVQPTVKMRLPARLTLPLAAVSLAAVAYTYSSVAVLNSTSGVDVVTTVTQDSERARAMLTSVRLPAVAPADTAEYDLASPRLWSSGDHVYDAFAACAPHWTRDARYVQWTFTEDAAAQTKSCTLTVTPDIAPGVAWGPVSSYNWNGDFGYWFDASGVSGGGCGAMGCGSGLWDRPLSGCICLWWIVEFQ